MILHLLHVNLLFLLCQPLLIRGLTVPLFFQGALPLPAQPIHTSSSVFLPENSQTFSNQSK